MAWLIARRRFRAGSAGGAGLPALGQFVGSTGTSRSPSTRSAGNSASEPVISRMVPPTAMPKTP